MDAPDARLPQPEGAPPALLVLAGEGAEAGDFVDACRKAGLAADRAAGREGALARFLERGGHDLLVLLEPGRTELEDAVRALLAVDPQLPVLRAARPPAPAALRARLRRPT